MLNLRQNIRKILLIKKCNFTAFSHQSYRKKNPIKKIIVQILIKIHWHEKHPTVLQGVN